MRTLLVHLAARPLRSRQTSLEVQRMSYGVGNILSLDADGASGSVVASLTKGQGVQKMFRECAWASKGAVVLAVKAGRIPGPV